MNEKPPDDRWADALREMSQSQSAPDDAEGSGDVTLPPLDQDIPEIPFDVDPDPLPGQPVEPIVPVPAPQAPVAQPPAVGQRVSPPKPSPAPPPVKAMRSLGDPARPADPSSPPPRPAPSPAATPKRPRPLSPIAPPSSLSDDSTRVPPPLAQPMQIIDDDDAVNIPDLGAADMSATLSLDAPARARFGRSLTLRRTVIPILLTLGVVLPALAGMWFATDPDSVVRNSGRWLPITFILLGATCLLLAVVNMAQVRHMLHARPPR